ncbi:MAG: calcium/sodium antiporter [Deltaproteobacteria bacterium]|nr:calcium/sodium antiporter [Deltaproteobacteria bacterium]
MTLAIIATIIGLVLLLWSADWFIEGAAVTARHIGAPPLLIGIVIVGFGTSAPEMVVSAFSAHQGNPALALGNAYGSNIANIALILGVTALVSPIAVHSQVLRKELPILCVVTAIAGYQIYDGRLTLIEGIIMLCILAVLMMWSIWQGLKKDKDSFATDIEHELVEHKMTQKKAIIYLVVGVIMLVVSSRVLVWGAVEIAVGFGVSDMIIGLTIIALGTSLPELAASISALRKNEHDLILGNVVGSNLFNTLGVTGIASVIHPMSVGPSVMGRDFLVMAALTLSLFILGYGFRGPARINRIEGSILLTVYLGYMGWLAYSVLKVG